MPAAQAVGAIQVRYIKSEGFPCARSRRTWRRDIGWGRGAKPVYRDREVGDPGRELRPAAGK